MILRALYDYYHRCGDLPAFGMELKEIAFLIVINKEGKFLRFEDRRIDRKSAQQFLVKKSVGRSSGVLPNILYDNSQYVFGYMPEKGDMEKMRKYYDAFKAKIDELYAKNPDNNTLKSLVGFYEQEPSAIVKCMQHDSLWEEIVSNLNKKYSSFSFLIEGDTEIVASKQDLIHLLDSENKCDGNVCLVSGNKGLTARVHSKTPFQGNSFASLVSFMEGKGYDSYGKSQGLNAPVSEKAEFAYTTAMNHMLRPDSHNKFSIGTRTFLFWASSDSEAAKASEESLYAFFGKADDDDPNRRIELVKQTFMSIYNGKLSSKKEDKFYILGLAPNSARIAVVYWAEVPLCEFARTISRHFEDMDIVDTRKDKKPYAGLHTILGAVTLGGKSSDVTPNLPDAVVKSIFQGLPYPASLFQACIRRIRAEQSVNVTRAAIIKAYLNRINDNNKNIQVMLDKENTNQGYLCGRLFAVLEKLQYAANKQDTIRSSYLNAASATPAAVFSTILKLSNSHFSKLAKDKKGLALYFDDQKEEIISMLKDFPDTLDLRDQGRFFLGYYHQKNYKENNENEE